MNVLQNQKYILDENLYLVGDGYDSRPATSFFELLSTAFGNSK